MRQPLYLVLGLLLALPVMGTPAWGQGAAPKVPRSQPTPPRKTPAVQKPEIPLYISASQLEADQDKRLIVFKGQVKVVYGEATLYADRLLVYYQPGEKGRPSSAAASKPQEISPLGDLGGEKIDRIEAQGKVRFVQGDRVATGEKAIYYRDQTICAAPRLPYTWHLVRSWCKVPRSGEWRPTFIRAPKGDNHSRTCFLEAPRPLPGQGGPDR